MVKLKKYLKGSLIFRPRLTDWFFKLAGIVAVCAPAVILLYFIKSFGVSVIFQDEWRMVPIMQQFESGTLSFSTVFAQANEHRILFPELAIISLAALTRWNTIAEMLFSWAILCLTALILFYSYWKSSPKLDKKTRLLILIPASFLMFGFQQWDSVLWGFVNQFYLEGLGAIGSLAALHTSKKLDGWFVAGILSAILATYSSITGLLVWFVGLLLIAVAGGSTSKKKMSVWIVVGCLAWAVYFYGWVRPSYLPSWYFTIQQPISATMFFLAVIGAPLGIYAGPFFSSALGLVIVTVVSVGIIMALALRLAKECILWICIILFIALSSMATTIGRVGFGVGAALAPRYAPLTSIGIIGAYFLGQRISWQARNPLRGFPFHALLTLILIGLIVSYGAGWQVGANYRQNREMSAYVLRTYRYQSDATIATYLVDVDFVHEWAPWLQQMGLNVFAVSQPTMSCSPENASKVMYWVESIRVDGVTVGQPYQPGHNQTIIVNSGQTLSLVGWAFDKRSNRTASAVFLVINGNISIPVLYGLSRPDIAKGFLNSRLLDSGWTASFSTKSFAHGINWLSLTIINSDSTRCYSTPAFLSVQVT